ncbi:DUF2207 domain-containing protein [Streptomyces sp. NPDC020983]|uniref:DUF2207 domain-containing protein n=1 Tax=Streptomyces sp. NPDC020983 TaxID=3365106 RepID=UPI0037B5C4D3
MNAVWLVIAALAMGCVAWVLPTVGNTERITRFQASATVAADGSARVTEIIDWDFGNPHAPKHGIYRDVPDLDDRAEVTATVDGKPVTAETEYLSEHETRIRVGDENRTVTPGVHRYRLTYPLATLVSGRRLAWNAVGTGWNVRVDDVQVQVIAPFRLTGVRCVRGASGARDGCPVAQPRPGHLVAEFATLAAHRGVTLSGTTAERVEAAAPASGPVTGPRAADRPHPWAVAAWVAGATLLGTALTALLLRRLGRAPLAERPLGERSTPRSAGQADPEGSGPPVRLVDLTRREKKLLPADAPPEDLSADRAGVLYAGRVLPEHRTALLMEAAGRGWLSISRTDPPVLSRTSEQKRAADDAAAPELSEALDWIVLPGNQVTLGGYNREFGLGWQRLGDWLERDSRTADLREQPRPGRPAADGIALLLGLLLVLPALGLTIAGAVLAGHPGQAWWAYAIPGAFAGGTALALLVLGWELLRPTTRGADLWLRVAAFRTFLSDPSRTGPLLETLSDDEVERYTRWAVALGVARAWSAAAEASARRAAPADRHRRFPTVALAVTLAATAAASGNSATSSGGGGSSSGGGGGGSVGSGGGGGGGGSW